MSKFHQKDIPNFSYCLQTYQAGLKLSKLGIKILVVFGDSGSKIEAQGMDKLPVIRVVANSIQPNGRKKPFVLMPKIKVPI